MALVAGCLDSPTADDPAPVDEDPGEQTYYVVAYHWGFATFDEEGTEHDQIEVPEGTELTLVGVNDHATDVFGTLPDPVEAELDTFEALPRTREHVEEGRIPEPEDATIEEMYDEVHGDDHDNDDDDGQGDDHDDGQEDDNDMEVMHHELIVPGYDMEMDILATADEPVEASFVADDSGTFEFVCIHYCGYGHQYMAQESLEVV